MNRKHEKICEWQLLNAVAQHSSRIMRNTLLGVLFFSIVGAAMAQTPPVAPTLPRVVRAIVDRIILCEHFAGEFNGDRSEHDKYVNSKMDQLRCGDALDRDVRSIREKYSSNPAVQKALDASSHE
ncbi:MAG: hypothetical protein LBQ32_07310 [Burkholderiaceae bacterium]|jgi:hypothetical protein|nr:hypothetical protein [Burkholderiaceae bacterium]